MNSRLATIALIVFALPAAAEDARFIGDFEDLEDNWKTLEGRYLTLEGRYSAFSRGRLRFANSSLRVTVPPNVRRPTASRAVRVRGRLRNDGGSPLFEAVSVEPTVDDEERLALARSRLSPKRPEEWFETADRFRGRAEYYRDEKLLASVREVEEAGIEALIRAAGSDATKLSEAAEVAKERGFATRHRTLLHHALRSDWEELQRALTSEDPPSDADVALFLDRIARDLPGSREETDGGRGALDDAYLRDPKGVFERADEEQQTRLAREFYAEVVSADVARFLREDNANAEALADRLETLLPDRPERAAAYRELAVASTLENLSALTEAEAVSLRDRLEAMDDERAGTVLSRWLAGRLPTARKSGGRALWRLAKDYGRLVDDEGTEEELLLEAYDADPRLVGVSDDLLDRGYELVGGAWRKKMVVPKAADEDVPAEIEVGMSGEQARAVLRTLPDETLRMASAGRVTEIWIYRTLGLVIEVRRTVGGRQSRVEKISELK